MRLNRRQGTAVLPVAATVCQKNAYADAVSREKNGNGRNITADVLEGFRRKLAEEEKSPHTVENITSGGKPISRTNIWREMKALCAAARFNPQKVFPHNLRHLFARTFYGLEKDIVKLADILGHSSVNTTRIYIVSTGEEHRRRMENLRLVI